MKRESVVSALILVVGLFISSLVMLFASGCAVPHACSLLCDKINAWAEACTAENKGGSFCSDGYWPRSDEYNRASKACWSAMTEWIVRTGSEKLDCNKPPTLPEKQH